MDSKATSSRTLILNQMNHPQYAVTVSTGFKGNPKQDTYPEPDESSSLHSYCQYWIQKQPQTGPLSWTRWIILITQLHSVMDSKATSNRTLILNQMNHPHYAVTVSTGFKSNLKQDPYPETDETSLCCYRKYWIQKQPQTVPLSWTRRIILITQLQSVLDSKATSNRTLILNQMNHPHYAVTVSNRFKGNLK